MKKLAIIGLLGAIGSGFLTFWFWWEGCDSFPCIENLRTTKMILIGFISSINAYLLFFFYTVYHKEVIGQFPWSKKVSSKGVLDEKSLHNWQLNSIHTYSRVRKMCYFAILCSIVIGFYGILISNISSTGTSMSLNNRVFKAPINEHLIQLYLPSYLATGLFQFVTSSWITIKGFPAYKTPPKGSSLYID